MRYGLRDESTVHNVCVCVCVYSMVGVARP